MKKIASVLLALMMALSLCAAASAEGEGLSVLILVPTMNDGSYFDAAVQGVKALEETLPGTTTEAIAMGAISLLDGSASEETELNTYRPFFTEACESGKYDLIVTMGAECNAALMDAAKNYPEQLFFSCDLQDSSAFQAAPLANVYGVTYSNKDLGYLAGFMAAQVTGSGMEKANEDKKVGVLVGVDFPGLNEYIGSFCQVCRDNGVTVYIDYAGDFTPDLIPAVKEKALAMYAQGVDVIWQVAGGAGAGVFAAAAEAGRYAFGVDCDQSKTVTDPDWAATIVTSFYADYPAAIQATAQAVKDGTFPGGTYPQVGLAEGFVGYAANEQFAAMVPQSVVDSVAELYATMRTSEVEIFSVVDDPEGWEALKQEVAPQ